MIDIINVVKRYPIGREIFTALDNISFTIKLGDFLVIDGPSGAGKSTLLYTIGGLIKPDSGKILSEGVNIFAMSAKALDSYRKNRIGFMFQQFHLMPYLTVIDNIRLGLRERDNVSAVDFFLERCSLSALRNKYPSELSVGEKQRTAFIRAIISRPELLIADEPTGNLDQGNSKVLMDLVGEYHAGGGTVILVSHDPSAGFRAGKKITMEKGKIIIGQS